MPRRWRAYRSLEWFIFIGLAMAAFFVLVAVVTLLVVGRQSKVVTTFLSRERMSGPYKYPGSPAQTVLPREPCDVDWDGDCDARDYNLVVRSAGECLGDTFYNRLADVDRDGCVTQKDLQKTFPERFPTPSTPGDTLGWQTYRNEKYGYTFQYPLGTGIYSLDDYGNQIPATPNSNPLKAVVEVYWNPAKGGGMDIKVHPGQTLTEEFIDNRMGARARVKEQVIIAGRQGYKIDDSIVTPEITIYRNVYYLSSENTTYEIMLYNGRVEEDRKTMDVVLQQMLSTFKFIE